MAAAIKRKTSLTLNAETLDAARAFGVNVSAVADAALERAVTEARQAQWRKDNEAAFDAQSKWHAENEHPLADIMMGSAASTWKF